VIYTRFGGILAGSPLILGQSGGPGGSKGGPKWAQNGQKWAKNGQNRVKNEKFLTFSKWPQMDKGDLQMG